MEIVVTVVVCGLAVVLISCGSIALGILAERATIKERAYEGLVFWKLGDNYVWTSPEDFERLRLTDRSE